MRALPFCAAPVASAASANAVPSGGGSITISGLSFGTDDRTPTASLTASDACGSSTWTSATTVVCAAQAYDGLAALRTAVSVSAVPGTVIGQFSFDGTSAWAAAIGIPRGRFAKAAALASLHYAGLQRHA